MVARLLLHAVVLSLLAFRWSNIGCRNSKMKFHLSFLDVWTGQMLISGIELWRRNTRKLGWSPAQIFVTVLFLVEESWRVQKLPAKFTIPPPPPAGSVSEKVEREEEIFLSVLWCDCLNGSEFFAMQWIRKETGNVCLPAEILQG